MIRPPVVAAVTRALQETVQPDDRVVVACSGGADSMVLLDVLATHRTPELAGLEVVVAHYNHKAQPRCADMEQLVRERATAAGFDCHVDGGPIPTGNGESFEHEARKARYRFLASVAQEVNACAVLTAHTRDDHDETILMMLLEGTGLGGLRGIPLNRPLHEAPGVRLVRPLLDVTREQIEAFARDHGVPFLDDPTNADTAFLRNRVRHVILPFLEEQGNAQIRKHLRALAAEAQAWVAETDERMDQLLARIWSRDTSPPALDVRGLGDESRALVSAALLHAVKDLGISPRAISRATIDGLVKVALGAPDHSMDLPERWRARKTTEGQLQFIQGARRDTMITLPKVKGGTNVIGSMTEVAAPGKTVLKAFGKQFVLGIDEVRLTEAQLAEHRIYHPPGEELVQPIFAFVRPYKLRARRFGDKYLPLGAPGRKRLKALFQEYRVPRQLRNDWPILVDGNDRIIWVVGMPIADDARVRDFDARIFRLMIHETGDGPFPFPLRR